MAIRINYNNTSRPGIRLSSVYTSESGAQYQIEINENTMTYKIKNVNSGRVYEGRSGISNHNVLYRVARSHLVKMGVVLKVDVRGYKEVKKPYLHWMEKVKNEND